MVRVCRRQAAEIACDSLVSRRKEGERYTADVSRKGDQPPVVTV
jgi:hypothetical protein